METKVTRYQSYSGTIAAGDTFVINRQGRSVTCLSASDDLEIVIDDGSRSFFTAGISMEFDEPFSKIQLHNPTGGPVTFLIATAMGKVDDNRLTASGNIKVLDPGAGGESFADVITAINASTNADVVAMMQNPDDQRTPVHLLGASEFHFNASSATALVLINPASNTGGAVLRTLHTYGSTTANIAIFASSSAPSNTDDLTRNRLAYFNGINTPSEKPLALPLSLPAGEGLYLIATGAGNHRVDGSYDLL